MKLRTPMKLSDQTLVLLKNFSSINQSILFKEGNKLRTISVMKNILAEATVEEDFPKDFGIYDLNQFLNGLSLHNNPDLDFSNDGYAVIREGKSRSKYFFADPTVIVLVSFLRSCWDHVGIVLGSCWDHFGIVLGSFWDRVGIVLGSFWDRVGIVLGSFWDRFGIVFGSFLYI